MTLLSLFGKGLLTVNIPLPLVSRTIPKLNYHPLTATSTGHNGSTTPILNYLINPETNCSVIPAEVLLQPTVSRPVSLDVAHRSATDDYIVITIGFLEFS